MSGNLIILAGKEARDMALDLWLDGFTSGAASAVGTLLPNATDEQADLFADGMCDSLKADPLAMDVVMRDISERVQGRPDSGPKNLTTSRQP